MDICLICLRTDRRIKVNTGLSEFHDELCGFTLLVAKTFYCSECEYLLTKFYKFKQKCMKASEVYRDWLSGEIKVPIEDLHKMLPPSSLGLWKPNRKMVTNVCLPVPEMQPKMRTEKLDVITTLQELIKNSYIEKEKVEYEPTKNKVIHNKQNEIISKNQSDVEENNSSGEEDFFVEEYLDINMIVSETDDDEPNNSNKSQETTCKKEVLRIERLEDEMARKLSQFGDIRTDDGVAINKELITKLMLHKAGGPVISGLWKATCLDDILDLLPVIETTLTTINNDEKNKKEVDYSSVFDIEYLTTPEMKLEEFKRRKTYECYVKAEYKCEVCYQAFKSSKFLEYHMKKWHVKSPGCVLCPICNTWNPKQGSHRLTHTAVYKCKLCPLVTYHRDSMQNHFEQHTGKTYSCEKCDITYKSRSAYLSHVGKNHRQGRNVCDRCGRGFVSPFGLRLHKLNSSRCTEPTQTATGAAQPAGGVRCDDCDVTLLSQEAYDAHVTDVHAPRRFGGQRLKINSDGLPEFRRLNSHSQKSRSRFTLAKHTCRVCNAVGTNFGWLRLHFKREHPNEEIEALYADRKPHLCDICGAGFSKVYALRDHKNVHTGVRPYACDLCPKRFRNANVMKEHRLRHFPSTMSCAHCGKQFKTKANLHTHMKVHNGERIYKCDICGKGFLHSASLNEHIRGVHYNVRRVKKRKNETELGEKRVDQEIKKTKIDEIDAIETNEYVEPEEIEIETVEIVIDTEDIENETETGEGSDTKFLETSKVAETETIETSEIDETETIETCEVAETETIETCEINQTETIETCEAAETETIETCEVAETETIETCEVSDTKIIKTSEDTKMRTKKEKNPFRVVILKGRL